MRYHTPYVWFRVWSVMAELSCDYIVFFCLTYYSYIYSGLSRASFRLSRGGAALRVRGLFALRSRAPNPKPCYTGQRVGSCDGTLDTWLTARSTGALPGSPAGQLYFRKTNEQKQ